MQRAPIGISLASLLSNAMPLAAQGATDLAVTRAREEVELRSYRGGPSYYHQTGPGRVTVFTHHNYAHDPRRKWYGLGGKYP